MSQNCDVMGQFDKLDRIQRSETITRNNYFVFVLEKKNHFLWNNEIGERKYWTAYCERDERDLETMQKMPTSRLLLL